MRSLPNKAKSSQEGLALLQVAKLKITQVRNLGASERAEQERWTCDTSKILIWCAAERHPDLGK